MFKTFLKKRQLFLNCLPAEVYELVKESLIEFKEIKTYIEPEDLDDYDDEKYCTVLTTVLCQISCSADTLETIRANLDYESSLEKAAYVMDCDDLVLNVEEPVSGHKMKKTINELNGLYKK